MKNKSDPKVLHFVFATCILFFLVMWFSRYIQITSFDLVQHFLLVDELDKYHGVRVGTLERIGSMAIYPPLAHWMAVIAGWFFGSGLVGITVVTVMSAFLVYVFIIRLVGANSLSRVILFSVGFLVLVFTRSQIGWEVVDNFFYPQLVADVIYIGILLQVSRKPEEWKQMICFLLGGLLTMWIQPLIAIHIFAAGCVLMALQSFKYWSTKAPKAKNSFICLVGLILGAIAITLTNPAFKVMRQIASNDGSLTFGYSLILLVAFICAAFGAWSIKRYLSGKVEYVDAVLGSAVVAALGLVLLQFALLRLHGDGSEYAIKKHMFIVISLGLINAVRIAASYVPFRDKNIRAGLVAPIFAGIASIFVLKGLVTPVTPILDALSYANRAVDDRLPGYVPGKTVSFDGTLPVMGNVMVSLTAFQHPWNAHAVKWQQGTPIKEGAEYLMIRRTPWISKLCDLPASNAENYVIVSSECINKYAPGETLTFDPSGLGWQYAASGWYAAEPWGTWTIGTDGGSVKLAVPPGRYQLTVEGRVYVAKQHPTQNIVVDVNGTDIATWNFDLATPIATQSVQIPEELSQSGSLRINLKAPGAVSPAQLGNSPDGRVLGIGVQKLILRSIP
jgi:hypothetical protein